MQWRRGESTAGASESGAAGHQLTAGRPCLPRETCASFGGTGLSAAAQKLRKAHRGQRLSPKPKLETRSTFSFQPSSAVLNKASVSTN